VPFALAWLRLARQARRVASFLYLTLSADHGEPALRDADESVDLADVGLSDGLTADIRLWNEDYQSVVQLSATERALHSPKIADLDNRGLALCERIAVETTKGTDVPKVGYYSEGQLRRLR
jgi:hypothetical protein